MATKINLGPRARSSKSSPGPAAPATSADGHRRGRPKGPRKSRLTAYVLPGTKQAIDRRAFDRNQSVGEVIDDWIAGRPLVGQDAVKTPGEVAAQDLLKQIGHPPLSN